MSDPETWTLGVSLLTDQGIKERSARAFIGSLLRDWDEATVADAIRAAVGKADAAAYIKAVLSAKPKLKHRQGRLKDEAVLPLLTPSQSREAYARHRDELKAKLR